MVRDKRMPEERQPTVWPNVAYVGYDMAVGAAAGAFAAYTIASSVGSEDLRGIALIGGVTVGVIGLAKGLLHIMDKNRDDGLYEATPRTLSLSGGGDGSQHMIVRSNSGKETIFAQDTDGIYQRNDIKYAAEKKALGAQNQGELEALAGDFDSAEKIILEQVEA